MGKVVALSIITIVFIISVALFLIRGYSAPNYVNFGFNFTNGTNYNTSNVFKFSSNWTNTTASGENVFSDPNTNFTLGRPNGTITVYNRTTTIALINNTTTLPVRLEITFTQDQLGSAGTYNYSFGLKTSNISNATQVWTNITPVSVFNITNASNPVNLYLNGNLNQNVTIAYGTQSNATGVAVYSNSGTLYLYRDEVQKATGTVAINETTTLNPGTYAYKINTTGNTNYSSNSSGLTYYLIVGTLADGSSCTANNQCTGGYCVHSICRSSSTYCGDSYCDSGESCFYCSSDCGLCPSEGLPQTKVTTTRGEATITIPLIAAGKMANVTITKTEDIAVRQISISVVNSVNNIKLTITKLPEKPAIITKEITGKVYHYMNLTKEKITDANINIVKIRFAVDKAWIINNDININTISLNRWNGQWNKLATNKVSETTDEILFEAESAGLSYFAISGEILCVENWSCTNWGGCVEGTQTRTCTDLNACGTTTNKLSENQSCAMPTFDSYIIVVIIIIMVAIGGYLLKWYRSPIGHSYKK